MGRDKALLDWNGIPLVLHVAATVRQAAGEVTLIGDPDRYGNLGLPVIPDLHPGCGPLAGIEAALEDTRRDWNLVVACDMPELTADFLRHLLDAAAGSHTDVVMATGPGGRPEPLCAVWNRSARATVAQAVAGGLRRVTDVLPLLRHVLLPVAGELHFRNLNTPEDLAAHAAR